uniref:Uncharacterized protein n=1 Tax=Romanomermis culicivorax TaxID=13658 RepID=A0A915IR22_ROMCU
MFRDSGHRDNQIKRLGRRKLAQKANRAKKREEEDVIEISDNKGEKTESTMSTESNFVGSTTLLTQSTKSKMKTMPRSQMPGTTSSMSQVQLTVVTAKVPSKSTTSQGLKKMKMCNVLRIIVKIFRSQASIGQGKAMSGQP